MTPLRLELTLAILKPHVVKNPWAVQEIKRIILASDLKIIESTDINFDNNLAVKFYNEHKEKFFFNRLITFMTSGPSTAYILESENAIAKWREIMGPTKVYRAQYTHPNSIRSLYGLSDTRNATHGSDSPESARREISILFPNFFC